MPTASGGGSARGANILQRLQQLCPKHLAGELSVGDVFLVAL